MFPDFFDSSKKPAKTEAAEESTEPKTMAEVLPEGFFDDPKQDAKVWPKQQKSTEKKTVIGTALLSLIPNKQGFVFSMFICDFPNTYVESGITRKI